MARTLLRYTKFGLVGVLMAGCVTQVGARFPEPSPGFLPRMEYDLRYEGLLVA
jgi:hypothetical protein